MNVRAAVLALMLVAATLSSEPAAGAPLGARFDDVSRPETSDYTGFAEEQSEVTYGSSLLPDPPSVTPTDPARPLTVSSDDCWIRSRVTSCSYTVIAVYSDGEFVYERTCTTVTTWQCY
jgi:hypothetical protein